MYSWYAACITSGPAVTDCVATGVEAQVSQAGLPRWCRSHSTMVVQRLYSIKTWQTAQVVATDWSAECQEPGPHTHGIAYVTTVQWGDHLCHVTVTQHSSRARIPPLGPLTTGTWNLTGTPAGHTAGSPRYTLHPPPPMLIHLVLMRLSVP